MPTPKQRLKAASEEYTNFDEFFREVLRTYDEEADPENHIHFGLKAASEHHTPFDVELQEEEESKQDGTVTVERVTATITLPSREIKSCIPTRTSAGWSLALGVMRLDEDVTTSEELEETFTVEGGYLRHFLTAEIVRCHGEQIELVFKDSEVRMKFQNELNLWATPGGNVTVFRPITAE